MHHESEKGPAIHLSVTALGLLRRRRRRRRRRKYAGGDIENIDIQCDSDELKGSSKCECPCTARLDGLNRDILRHNEGIW